MRNYFYIYLFVPISVSLLFPYHHSPLNRKDDKWGYKSFVIRKSLSHLDLLMLYLVNGFYVWPLLCHIAFFIGPFFRAGARKVIHHRNSHSIQSILLRSQSHAELKCWWWCAAPFIWCGLGSHEERNRKHTTRRAFMFRNVMPTYLCCRYIYLLFDCEKCTQPERTVFVSRMWLNNKINNITVILHLYLTCIVGRSYIILLLCLGRPSSAHMRLCVFVFMATGYV